MPESRTRKSAEAKQKLKAQREAAPNKIQGSKNVQGPNKVQGPKRFPGPRFKGPGGSTRIKAPASRRWVPPTFITVGLLGVAWLITFYVAGQQIPLMSTLGNWNILIGMGGMAAAFGIATLWK